MNFQVKLIKIEQRRAVSPIIATLLMVAISVVGGILIFVFAQGFFKDTSLQSPALDALLIFGFYAKDVNANVFVVHTGETITCGKGLVEQFIDDEDCFAIFIRNVGANPAILEIVRVFGKEVPIDTGKGVTTATLPGKGKYCLLHTVALGCTGQAIIDSGEDMTLLVSNNKALFNGKIKLGRPILFQLETGQGQVFTKQIIAGLSSGV